MKIAIVGAGWFGCHIGAALREYHDVRIFEEKSDILMGSAGSNQSRLHLGFHYPRSKTTRILAKQSFDQFMKVYGGLTDEVKHNIYAVAEQESLIDFETYRQIMSSEGLAYEQVDPAEYGLTNVSGCIRCDERLVRQDLAREYFRILLEKNIQLDRAFTLDDMGDHDWVINCSSQLFMQYSGWELCYEPCVILRCESEVPQPAVTIMDGDLCNIYPTGGNSYALYSVELSPVSHVHTAEDARKVLAQDGYLHKLLDVMEEQFVEEISHFIPDFRDRFVVTGQDVALRVVFVDYSDTRAPALAQVGKIIHILSPHIGNIFHAERMVKVLLGEEDQDGAKRQAGDFERGD